MAALSTTMGAASSSLYRSTRPGRTGAELHRQTSTSPGPEWRSRAATWSEAVMPSVSPSWVMMLQI